MELETEKLLQKWLKMQIWKQSLSFIMWILIVLSVIIGGWTTYFYILPPLKKQIENTQSLLEQVSTVSESTKGQENLLRDFFKEVPR